MLGTKLRAVALAVALGSTVVGCGKDTSDEAYIARAMAYLEEGEIKASEIELKNALQENPRNFRARKELGALYFKVGNLPAAEKELLRVYESEQADDFPDLRPLLARAQLGMNRFTDIAAISLDNLEGENLATLLGAQALASLSDGDMTRAKQRIAQALAAHPEAGYALYASAKVQALDNEFDAALVLLDQVISQEPGFIPALTFKADVLRSLNRPEEALAAYTEAMKKNPALADARYKRSLINVRLQNLEAAQKDVDVLLEQAAQNPSVNYAQGLIHFYSKNYEDAVSALVIAESDKFRFPDVMLYLALSHLRLGNIDQALSYATDFNAAAPKHTLGIKLLASLLLNRGKAVEAENLIQQFLARIPNDVDALNLLANALVAQKRTDEALNYLAKVVEIDPDSEAAQIRFSAGLADAGKTKEALERADMAIEMNPEYALGDMVKVLAFVRAGQLDDALTAAIAFSKKKPVDAAPQLLLGRVYLARQEKKKAIAAYNKAAELEPGSPAANNALAAVAIVDKDYSQAHQYFNEILQKHPDHLQTLLALAGVEAHLGNEEKMVAYIKQANVAHPKAGQPKVLLAQYFLEKNQPGQAQGQLTSLTAEESRLPITLRLKARIELALKNVREARALMMQLLEELPYSGPDHALMAKVYLALGDEDKQREHLQKAVEYAPDVAAIRYEMALRALQDRDGPLLAQQLTELDKLAPNLAVVRQLHAAQASLSGDPEKALGLLQELHQKQPSSMSLLNVARQQRAMGRKEASLKTLQAWIAKNDSDIPVRLSLAETYLREGKKDEAIRQYETVLSYNADNVVALNNLAWFLKESNPPQALEYAHKATDVVKNSPPLLDTLALVQAENKQYEQALVTLRDALRLTPDVAVMEYHYAEIQHMKGDDAAAVKSLRKVLDKHKVFPEREAAQALLKKLSQK